MWPLLLLASYAAAALASLSLSCSCNLDNWDWEQTTGGHTGYDKASES